MTAARLVLRLCVAVSVLLVVTVGLAGPAAAHNVLISSEPADGATLNNRPTTISFTFDQPVQNFDPVISITGPDGRQYQSGTAQISGNVVSSDAALGTAGAYIAAYRIVSADGHPVTGEIRFTLAAGAAGTPAAGSGPVAGSATAPAGAGNSGTGFSAWLWIGLVVAAVLIAGAAIVLLRRPSGDSASRVGVGRDE